MTDRDYAVASHTWATVKHSLESTTGRDFEREALPHLRIKWRNLTHARAIGKLDKCGVDLVCMGSGNPLEVVIQCKGFAPGSPLGASQLRQIEKSIESFRTSGLRCRHYVLVHNREGRDRAFASIVEAKLKVLVGESKAGTAELWDIDRLIRKVDRALSERVTDEISRRAELHKARRDDHFLFKNVIVKDVPFIEGDLVMRRHERPHTDLSAITEVGDPAVVLAMNENQGHWTLVMGSFGSGKSTLAWRLLQNEKRRLLYIPAAALAKDEARAGSENLLIRDLVEYLGIFDDAVEFSEDERAVLVRLAAPLLAARLRAQDTKFVLLIDGLDENRFYGSMEGLHVLRNELQRASCPVILTTRREHFEAHYASYAQQLTEASRFSKPDRRIRLLDLQSWTSDTATTYVNEAIKRATPSQAAHLNQLRAQIESVGLSTLHPLNHPLLLAMMVDLVAQGGMSTFAKRTTLYERWIDQKLLRDFSVPRVTPAGHSNLDELCWLVKGLMGAVACSMTSTSGEQVELTETIQESDVRALSEQCFGAASVPSEVYAVSSFLEPVRRRRTGGMTLRFFHRSFQEYFLATALVERRQSVHAYPQSVREFAEDIYREQAGTVSGLVGANGDPGWKGD